MGCKSEQIYGEVCMFTGTQMWQDGHFGIAVFTLNVVSFGHDFAMVTFGIVFFWQRFENG